MEPVIVWYLRMSVFYFVTGAAVGLALLVWPAESGSYIPVHVHLNLLGFMSMMIYGVGYHILPRFSGRNIYSPSLVKIQFWLSNVGLIAMALIWPAAAAGESSAAGTVLMLASVLSLAGVVIFAFNILKTIKSA
jgi:cbb3-type cytochrome oxidase subunit 1